MNTKMYVGNLPFDVSEQQLRDHFAPYGMVTELNLMMDRETGRPRGFAFVTMDEASNMERAIRELDGKELAGRALKINEARPRENRSFGGGGGGGFGGGGARGKGGGSRKGNRGRDKW